MTAHLYSGKIDWEEIYTVFHSPSKIAEHIIRKLDCNDHPLVFSGFAETAACLANLIPVTFVDLSPSVTARTIQNFSTLSRILTGDVTQLMSSYPTDNVVIACRISAYWGSEEFDRFTKSLRSFPRKKVLIDFFDRDVVQPGQRVLFESPIGGGEWVFLGFEDIEGDMPLISKAKLNFSYSIRDNSFSYEGDRSFFRKENIEQWCKAKLSEYRIKISSPLLDSDPSFTLSLTHDRLHS